MTTSIRGMALILMLAGVIPSQARADTLYKFGFTQGGYTGASFATGQPIGGPETFTLSGTFIGRLTPSPAGGQQMFATDLVSFEASFIFANLFWDQAVLFGFFTDDTLVPAGPANILASNVNTGTFFCTGDLSSRTTCGVPDELLPDSTPRLGKVILGSVFYMTTQGMEIALLDVFGEPSSSAIPERSTMVLCGLGSLMFLIRLKPRLPKFGKCIGMAAVSAAMVLGQDWSLVTIAGPHGRVGTASVYDPARRQVVLFGGMSSNSNTFGDTWVWNGAQWTQKFPSTSPSPRFYHAMAYDAARGQVVLFGGYDNAGYAGDTWVWDGTNWSQKNPHDSPSARAYSVAAYDATHGQVVLFGGQRLINLSHTQLDETWIWDGNNWTAQTTAIRPSPRIFHSLGFDGISGKVILFGGGLGSPLSDTWSWDGDHWTKESPATSPTARFGHAGTSGVVVITGGMTYANVPLLDTWSWNGSNWTERKTAHSAFFLSDTTATYDPRGKVLLFGGHGVNGESWVLSDLPADVSGQVSITASSFSLSRVTGTWVGTVTITNNSSAVVHGPLNVLLSNLAPQLKPLNGSGLNWSGIPYVAVPGFDDPNAQLIPGQTVIVPVQFPAMTFSPTLLSGAWK